MIKSSIESARKPIITENKKIMHYSDEHEWTEEQIKNTASSELMASIMPMWLSLWVLLWLLNNRTKTRAIFHKCTFDCFRAKPINENICKLFFWKKIEIETRNTEWTKILNKKPAFHLSIYLVLFYVHAL